MPTRSVGLNFSDMSGGLNTKSPQHALMSNQVRETLNMIHENIGGRRAPGYYGFGTSALFTTKLLGLFAYKKDDGTDVLIGVSNGKVYSIDTSLETKTEIGDMAGASDAYAVNAVGKLWIVNGTSFVKVESDLSVYPVQIAAPTGTSAVKKAGGTLPDGVYGCYVSYARKDADGRYLYSLPYSLGNVTLGSGDNTITFTVPNSSDGQVTNKVFWMTDAGGATPYYYGETDNSTTAYDISDNSNRIATNAGRMDINASSNQVLPINPSGIYHFDDRLIVWYEKTFYWSMKTDVNPFNLERFFAENFRTVSVIISSMFNVDADMYINSVGNGIYRIPSADYTAVIKRASLRIWFEQCNTEDGKKYCVEHNGIVFGYTNDGVRFFDGARFSDDLSLFIKPEIDRVTAGATSTFVPAMTIFRREGLRTELRLSYRDLNHSSTINNMQLVLNIDTLFDPIDPKRSWEYWSSGFFAYAQVNGAIYAAQRKTSDGVIVKESGVADQYCYNKTGTFLTARTAKEWKVTTRTILNKHDVINIWGSIYALATANGTIGGNFVLFDSNNTKFPFTLVGAAAGLAILPAAGSGGLVMPFVLAGTFPRPNMNPMPFDARSLTIAIELSQTEDDPSFRLYELQLPKVKEISSNLT